MFLTNVGEDVVAVPNLAPGRISIQFDAGSLRDAPVFEVKNFLIPNLPESDLVNLAPGNSIIASVKYYTRNKLWSDKVQIKATLWQYITDKGGGTRFFEVKSGINRTRGIRFPFRLDPLYTVSDLKGAK